MRGILIFCFLIGFFGCPQSQNLAVCKFYAKKSKLFFLIENHTDDTLHLSTRLDSKTISDNPQLGIDYSISNDSFFLFSIQYKGQSIQSNGEPLTIKIDGVRWHPMVLPNDSFEVYLKLIDAKKIAKNINHVIVISDKYFPPMQTIHIKKSKLRF